MTGLNLKFKFTDSGNCRVCYTARNSKNQTVHYCLQAATIAETDFVLHRCSSDWEPSYPIPLANISLRSIDLPPADTKTGLGVIEFLANL